MEGNVQVYENDTGEHILRTLKESKKSNKKQTNKQEREKEKKANL